MKKIKIILTRGRKKLNLQAFDCNFLEQGIGLMFSRERNARILAFRFKKKSHLSIHSFFVFFPFIAVWTDDKNRILCWKKVKPFTFHVPSPASGFFNLVEIPMTKNYFRKVKFFK
jgi:uncharacterized membrane protein (UPF0127 family)